MATRPIKIGIILVATALGAFIGYLDEVLPGPTPRDAERLLEAGFFLAR